MVKLLNREELAWAGGLFEGEGCLYVSGTSQRASAQVKMTDLDPILRFRDALGFGIVREEKPGRPNEKLIYVCRVNSFEYIQALIAMLWPWLGVRRRAKAREVLAGANNPAVFRRFRLRRSVPLVRQMFGKGVHELTREERRVYNQRSAHDAHERHAGWSPY